jgi:DNA polymerase-3 subunit delta
MNLRPEQLAAHLERPLGPLYVLHGNEPLLVIEASDAIRAAARAQGYGEREVLIAGPNFRWDELQMAAGNLSLFGGDKLIDLRIPNGKPGRDGGEALQRFVQAIPRGVVTLVTLPELDWQTKKAAWFVALGNAGAMLELIAPGLAQLPAWLAQRLKRQNQTAPREALDFIAEHVEGNLLAAHQEMQKLGLLYPPGELTLAQVEDAVLHVARYDIDGLRSAVLEGDAARCARLLDGLRGEDAAPPLVLWALATEARTLAQLRSVMDRSGNLDAAFSTQRIHSGRQGPYRAAMQRLPRGAALAALLHAARIDRMIKGLARGDLWDEFLQLALRFSGRKVA